MHPAKLPSQDDVLQYFRRAGFTTLTSLQERLLPPVLRGKDVAVEAAAGSGRTVGFLLPFMIALRGAGPAPQVLVLSAAPEDVGKVARAALRIARTVRDAPIVVPLGEIEDARREQRRLEKGATIVAGTTERVIDHIRRGSLVFGDLLAVVVTAPDGPGLADFVKDVQFIFAKIAERPQTILFSQAPLTEDNELFQLLRHPFIIGGEQEGATAAVTAWAGATREGATRQGATREGATRQGATREGATREGAARAGASRSAAAPAGAGHLFITVDAGRPEDRSRALARVILGMRISSAVVYHSPRTDGRAVAEALRASGVRGAALAAGPAGGRGQPDRRGAVLALARKELDVLLVPMGAGPGTPELQEASPSHVLFLDAGSARPAPGRVRPGAVVIALVDQGQEKEVARLQEAIGVTMSKGLIPSDDEVLTGAIDRIVRRIQTEDKAELAALRTRIRRQVPLLLRPLFMAALLKAQLPPLARLTPARAPARAVPEQPRPGQARPAPARPAEPAPGPRGRFGRIAGAGPAPRGPRPDARAEGRPGPRGDGPFAQLFVSIGRNRRVYARDLTALFTERLSLSAGDIGGVRVFEKYSFVDIVPSRAEEAIAKLSGTELKGRTITVNFAKKKEEKEGA